MNGIRTLLSMPCMLLGYSFEPRPNSRALWYRGSIWPSIYCIRLKENATHNLGIPVVLKGDLLWYSFRRTSAFSAPSWIINLVGTKMSNTINLTFGLSNDCVAQWIMRRPSTSKVSGSTPAGWDLFSFFRSFVSFKKKTYRKRFAASFC